MDPDTGKIYNPILFVFQLLWVAFKLMLVPLLFLPVLIYLQILEWRDRVQPKRQRDLAEEKGYLYKK